MADLATPEPYRMRTPPAKSQSRDSVSATRRAKTRALAEKKSLNLLTVTDKDSKFMSFKKTSHKTVIDSGASTDLRPTSCSVSAAFGETAQPTEMGLLPRFMLKTIVIDQMNDTTLLSVSQACAKGFVGNLTSKDCKFFNAVTRTPVRAVRVQAYVRIGSRTIRSTRFIAMIPAVFICKLTT